MPPVGETEEKPAATPGISVDKGEGSATSANSTEASPTTSSTSTSGGIGRTILKFSGRHKKGLIGGGAATGGIITLLIAASPLLAVFKLEHLYQNEENKEFGKLQAMMEQRLDRYMAKYVAISSYDGSLDGSKYFSSHGVPANSMFESWYKTLRASNFESQLAANQHVVFARDKTTGLLTKITFPDGEEFDPSNNPDLTEAKFETFENSSAARSGLRDAIQSETNWWNFLKRRHLRHWMQAALGVHKWHIFQGTTDKVSNYIRAQYSAYVLAPVYSHIGSWIDDLLNSSPVSDNLNNPSVQAPNTPSSSEGQEAETDAKAAGEQVGTDAGEAASGEVGTGTEWAPNTIFDALFGQELSDDASGPLGVAKILVSIVNAIHNNTIGKIITVRNSLQYASAFSAFAVTVDNLKNGTSTSGSEVNAVLEKYNGVENGIGYSNVFGTTCNSAAVGSACTLSSEQSLNPDASKLSSSWNSSPFGAALNGVATAYNDTIGRVQNAAGAALGPAVNLFISGITAATGFNISDFIAKGASKALDLFLGPVIDGGEVGASLFNAIDIGGDVTATSFTQSIGGHSISTAQANSLQLAFESQLQQTESQQPLTTQLASLNDPYSVASKLISITPTSWTTLGSNLGDYFGSFMSNPLGVFGQSFRNLIYGSSKSSSASGGTDIYGLAPIGFTNAELNTDPLDPSLSPSNCQTQIQAFQTAESNDDYSVGSLCLFDQAMMQASMAEYTTADDGGVDSDDSCNPIAQTTDCDTSPSGASSPVAGNSAQLAAQILANKNITESGRDVTQDLQAAAAGQNATAGVPISSVILQLIATVGQSNTVDISAIESGGSGHCNNTPKSACPNDPHYLGDAVDFDSLNGVAITGRNAPALTIIQIAIGLLPTAAGADGVDSGFGQSECGTTPPLPAGLVNFSDTCNHLHVQVAGGTP